MLLHVMEFLAYCCDQMLQGMQVQESLVMLGESSRNAGTCFCWG
jgi:hypothetical protein